MADVMWARPSGARILLAPDEEVAAFVDGVYSFDGTRVVPFQLARARPERLRMKAGPLELELVGGRASLPFALRPRRMARSPRWVRLEDVLLRPLVGGLLLRGGRGVRAYGLTVTGVREWYRIDGCHAPSGH
jgi:hypothetical protein